ncbi:MAG: short-chain fatty acyl-CoA regulator family protein [Hyphomicrobium sp.]|jgi:predicted transcriptional regulator/DNA-binding XRE family transcriptional regulator|uniref:short-chain fatty acyl-CoA regulator family protein n=1 Tax=Hyphomicrobium sp. TaxID=82 RepID=UPI0025BE67C3|nr:short-chain fatty acyl-CoA regulator family protein [Hyphomicrobium sp.]MBX9864029.1 short-chain fatty acyl-CoA regulator family protein [Hyphomicrobium sp.]
MRKAFMGVRLKRLREERGLTQVALARALDLSASYLNQLEKNQRPLTVPILLKINAVFGVDVQLFSEDEEARLIADLRDVFADPGLDEQIAQTEIREIVANMPAVGRALVKQHQRMRQASERADALAARLGVGTEERAPVQLMPFERVRDYFYANHNYFADLDEAAEATFAEARLSVGDCVTGLKRYLASRLGIQVIVEPPTTASPLQRSFDASNRILRLSSTLMPGQIAFEMATQLAYIEKGDVIETLARDAASGSEETYRLARIGLATHFAGALIMPYGLFFEAAERLRYDIELLRQRFGVGFETICHRLSTLQRPEARGVPFFFVRVDRAGNISKRQSATDFHFSRVGGSCPLWNVYEAFSTPGRILTQLASMPDGRTYLWIARTVSRGQGGFGAPSKTFAIGLGCDLSHAHRTVYAKGLDLKDQSAAVPIGAGCKICERPSCPQRAFPAIGRRFAIDENERRFTPYPAA